MVLFSRRILLQHRRGGESFSVDEDVGFIYNITVNNTDTESTANITQVNITIPNTFSFLADSNGTDAGTHTFTNTSTVLSWDNDGLVMNLTWRYFWFNATASTPGSYNLTISTKNATGTETTNISVTINDTTPPTINLNFPVDNYNTSSTSVDFNFTATDAVSDILECSLILDGNVNQTNSTVQNNTPTIFSVSGLSEGSHNWNISCKDMIGNQDISETRSLNVDTTAPTFAFGDPTEDDNANKSQSHIPVNISAEDVTLDVDKIVIRFYNSTNDLIQTNTSDAGVASFFVNLTGLDDGVYTYNATINDTVGNENKTATRTITLDTIAPDVIAFNTPSNNANISSTQVINVTVNDTVGVSTVYFNVSNGTRADFIFRSNKFSAGDYWNATINGSALNDGFTYNITVYANDSAGNLNNSEYITITYDGTSPTASASCNPSSVYVNGVVTCICSGSDDGGSGINSTLTTASSTPSTSRSGTFTYSCSVTDYAGNSASSSANYVVNAVRSGGGSSTTSFWKSTHAISDEQFQQGFTNERGKGERFRVVINNKNHHIGIVDLTDTTATINVSSEPMQVILSIGQDVKFDVTDNGYYDIYVLLNSIENSKANITIQETNEKIPEGEGAVKTSGGIIDDEGEDNVGEEKNKTWIIIGIVLILVVLIGAGIIKKKSK